MAQRLHPAALGLPWQRLLFALAAIPAGLLADWAGFPAAWLIGPMLITLALVLAYSTRPTMPRPLYAAAQAVIGAAVSASFDPLALAALTTYWLPVIGSVVLLLAMSLLSGFILARSTGLDLTTAVIGTIPGGASSMVAMSDELEAETPLVAFMQYTRVVLVAVSASLLARFVLGITDNGVATQVGSTVIDPIGQAAPASIWLEYLRMIAVATIGAWLGVRLNLPAGVIVGPVLLGVILGAFGIEHGQWPPGILPAANALIGINVGLRFHREALRQVRRLFPAVLSLNLLLIAGCALLGVALMMVTGLDVLSTYLATTPGGIDAVTIAALDTGANTAVILPIQILRLLVMVFAGPFLARWLHRRSRRSAAHRQPGQEINL